METKDEETLRVHLGARLVALWEIDTELDAENNQLRTHVVTDGDYVQQDTTSLKRTVVDVSPFGHHLTVIGQSPVWRITPPAERWSRSADGSGLRLGQSFLSFDTEEQQKIYSESQPQATGFSRLVLMEEFSSFGQGDHQFHGKEMNFLSTLDYLIQIIIYPLRADDNTKPTHLISKGNGGDNKESLQPCWSLHLDSNGQPTFKIIFNDGVERIATTTTTTINLFEKWSHVAILLSKSGATSTITLSVDGAEVGSLDYTLDPLLDTHMHNNDASVVLGGGDLCYTVNDEIECEDRPFIGNVDMVSRDFVLCYFFYYFIFLLFADFVGSKTYLHFFFLILFFITRYESSRTSPRMI